MKTNIIDLFSRYRNILFSVALMLFLVSCLDDDEGYISEPIEVAYVSIYHAAPDAPDFDILVDGRVINQAPFDYTSYSGYLNFFTGNRELRFNAVNADNAIIDTTFNFQDGKAYSLFAINRSPDALQALLVTDSAGTPAAGKAMVRFIHLSPDAPAFDLVRGGEETPLVAAGAFTEASEFLEIDADTYSFDLRNPDTDEIVLSADDVEILPGRFYTVVVRGFAALPEGNSHELSIEVLD